MNNIRSIWDESVNKFKEIPAVRWLVKKDIHQKTYGELDEEVKKVRAYLEKKGYRGSHIAIIGSTSPEWVDLDF